MLKCFLWAESQQKQIQTNIGHLSPQEKDLAEIHDREQRIVDLLNEQRQQQLQYEELSKLQQQRLEEQASFMEERKVSEVGVCRVVMHGEMK